MKGNLTRLLTLEIRREQDLLLCRQRARRLAAAFGFDRQEQTRVATAVSEIVRNALEHARGGKIEFAVDTMRDRTVRPGSKEQQSLVMTVRDQGPGIAPFAKRTTGAGPRGGFARRGAARGYPGIGHRFRRHDRYSAQKLSFRPADAVSVGDSGDG